MYFSYCICRQQTFHAAVFFNMCVPKCPHEVPPILFCFLQFLPHLTSLINHYFHNLWHILYLHYVEVLNYRIWDILKSRNLEMLIQYHSPQYHATSRRIQQYLQKKMILLSSPPHESMLQPQDEVKGLNQSIITLLHRYCIPK